MNPLGIIQNGGGFGVSLFLVISGYLFSKPTSWLKYLRKKIRHILVPFWATTALFAVVTYAAATISGKANYWTQFSVQDWAKTLSFGYYFMGQSNVVHGVTWYLVPQFYFYIVFSAFLLVLKENLGIWTYVLSTMVLCWARYPISSILPFALMPIFGYLYKKYEDNAFNIKFVGGTFLLLMSMIICFEWCNPGFLGEEKYLVSFLYAYLLFMCTLQLGKTKKSVKNSIQKLNNVSYYMYLVHSTFGAFAMSSFESRNVPFTVCFLVGIVTSYILSVLLYKVDMEIDNLVLIKDAN